MRHLFVTQDYPPDLGGMARRHVELCRRTAPDEIIVSTVDAPDATPFDAREPYRILRQPFPFSAAKRFTNQMAWGADLTTLAQGGVDLFHLGNVRPCGYAVAVAARRTGIPYLVYVNGGDLLREREKTAASRFKRWSARDIFGRAAGIVANSQWTAELAAEVMQRVGIDTPPPVAAIDLGTDPAHFAPARDRGTLRRRLGLSDVPVVLTVARLVPHKGQDTALRAVAAVADAHPTVHYLVVGDGVDRERLQGIAESLGLADRVVFTGALSDDDIAEAYATADVYLGLSRVDSEVNAEGFGISLVEAASSGTPSIAGDSGGVRSAVRDGVTGFVVPPTGVVDAADALARLLSNDILRRQMGIAGRRAAETHYNWDRVARETFAFARDRVADGRGPRLRARS